VSYDWLFAQAHRQPPGAVVLIGKTERTLQRNVIHPMRLRFGEDTVSDIHGQGVVTIAGRDCYVVGANDERARTKIQGQGYILAYGDEVTTWAESFFTMLKSRLDKPESRFLGTCNPEGPYHWLKRDMIDRAGDLNVKHWHFTIDDNPFLAPEVVADLKREYAGVWYKRYILGLWVAAEGAVYDMFDPQTQVVKELPAMRRYWVGIDYGTTNPTVFLLLGEGVDNCLYVCREWRWDSVAKSRQKTDAQYSADYRDWIDVSPDWVFIDPSAASFINQLWQDGVKRIAPADNAVLDGIRATSSLLSAGRLKIHESCKGLIEEMSAYIWDKKAEERGEDKPLKTHDHGPDALRYAINGTRNIWARWIRRDASAA
jgi:PBSX family phage terminase large subunit